MQEKNPFSVPNRVFPSRPGLCLGINSTRRQATTKSKNKTRRRCCFGGGGGVHFFAQSKPIIKNSLAVNLCGHRFFSSWTDGDSEPFALQNVSSYRPSRNDGRLGEVSRVIVSYANAPLLSDCAIFLHLLFYCGTAMIITATPTS